MPTAVHCTGDGQATANRPWPTVLLLAPPGAPGSKVMAWPAMSTAVHWVGVGQASLLTNGPESIDTGDGLPGAVGSNVTSLPAPLTATHSVLVGQTTSLSDPAFSGFGEGVPGFVG